MVMGTYEAFFLHDGDAIDYTPAVAVAAGAVIVQNNLVGVAKVPIAADEKGALAVSGVFNFAKADGTGESIDAGELVYWDDVANVVTTASSGNILVGKCVLDADDDDTVARCRLDQ